LVSGFAFAICGPKAYITEWVSASYYANGTPTSTSKTGQMWVSVPNNDDVLQQVNLTLNSEWDDTNLDNNRAYRNVVWSDPANDTDVNLMFKIGGTDQSVYTITNHNDAPTINLSFTYFNNDGGHDVFDADNIETPYNTFTFNLTIENPSTTKTLESVKINIWFERDVVGAGDSVDINSGSQDARYIGGAPAGTVSVLDTDGDGDNDHISWTGPIGHSSSNNTVYITFTANITEGYHFPGSQTYQDLGNSTSTTADYSQSGTLTGLAFTDKFARCSVRQGIDLSEVNNEWNVRGFIRNIATEDPGGGECYLTYNVSEWRIYEIDPSTGAPYSSPNQTGKFNATEDANLITPADGRIYTTNDSRSSNTSWFNTGMSAKPYFTVYFDWEVVWETTGSEVYAGYINTTMDLPTLYKIDMNNEKKHVSGYIAPDTGGQPVTIRDNTTFAGDPNAPAKHIEIFSVIPANTTAGLCHGNFTIDTSSIEVYYINASGSYRLNISSDQSAITVTVTQVPVGCAYNGSINVSIIDISQAELYGHPGVKINRYFNDNNDGLSLEFTVLSASQMTTGDSYVFTGNTTMTTESGTQLSEIHPTVTVPVSAKRLTGYKDLWIPDVNNPTLVNGSIIIEVETGSGGYIDGIRFIDYVPNGTGVDLASYKGNVTVRFYDGSSWTTWTEGTDYNITDNGTVTLSDGTVLRAFEFVNASGDGGFNLTNGQVINVSYQLNITQEGVWVLPVEIAGFDPDTGLTMRAVAYGIIRIDIPQPSMPLQITEGELSLAKRVIVGKPAVWIKQFEVYNPNGRVVSTRFRTEVFNDATEGYASYIDESGRKIEERVRFIQEKGRRYMYWDTSLNPLETRSYELRILTPPVLEIDRDVEVLEKLERKKVKLKMDVFLKSFAEEDYSNVVLNLPIPYENIIEARDGFGNKLQFTGGRESSSVIIDTVKAKDMKTVTIIYKESYPTIIVTPDRDRYNLNSPVNLEILIINGGDEIKHPYLEIEIYTPDMQVIYSSIQKLEGMKPLEKTELYERFVIPAMAPGGMYMASARFREDFVTLASTTGNFYVAGISGVGLGPLGYAAVLVAAFVLVYFSAKRLKEVRSNRYGVGI